MTHLPSEFYKKQSQEYLLALKEMKQQLFASAMIRLSLFIALCFGIYYTFGNTKWTIAIVLFGITAFVLLIARHSNINFQKKILQELIAINQKELAALKRNLDTFPEGNGFKDPFHEYSDDIDLFGKGSFFQYINRTSFLKSTQKLVSQLTSNDIENVPQKQFAIQELAKKIQWRQQFSAFARVTHSKESKNISTEAIVEILKTHRSFIPKAMKWIPSIFSILSILLFVSYFTDIVREIHLLLWFVAGMVFTGVYFKRVSTLASNLSKIEEVFYQQESLIKLLEDIEFDSGYLKSIQSKIFSSAEKASQITKRFARILDTLEQRNNMVFGVLANGFFLWDLKYCYSIEKWMLKHKNSVEIWFEAVAEIDALNSLANFTYNHPTYTFPKIGKGKSIIQATNLAHPLLHPKKAVSNDFEIEKENFFIITGANMAGKSTFLRTVALSIVMANTGLPVAASRFIYNPIKLITSMRTSDSLNDEESYFFSELKRLKFIVESLEKDTYFIVLDEILKGTNSIDKALGSRKFVSKLVASNSTGIIATHDLSLCKISSELEDVKNFYFDAEIINDELHFDYHIKRGVVKNMNASFLLKKMNIID